MMEQARQAMEAFQNMTDEERAQMYGNFGNWGRFNPEFGAFGEPDMFSNFGYNYQDSPGTQETIEESNNYDM
jgi:hypothetical protein